MNHNEILKWFELYFQLAGTDRHWFQKNGGKKLRKTTDKEFIFTLISIKIKEI